MKKKKLFFRKSVYYKFFLTIFHGINAYSKIIWNNLQNLRHLEPSLSFLKTHQLPIDDSDLLIELLTLELTYIPDSISLLSFMNLSKIKDLSKMNIVGLYNLELEEKLIKLVNYENRDIQITNTELIMDIDNYISLVSYDNFDYYFKMIDSGTLSVYICEKCNFFIGITEEFGILCLQDLTNVMDYQQCLVFLNPKALSWLNKWYNQIKQRAKRIPFSKKVLKNKDDILKYLKSLKD